ncbi:MAG TPA: hypothetical protein VGC41_09910, partial [Kofleriaceae bacterium]
MRLSLGLMFASSIVVGACADHGGEGFYIVNNSAVPVGGTCVFTGGLDQAFQSAGSIAFHSPVGYQLVPLLVSNITAEMDQMTTRSIHLEGANIHAEVANGGTHQDYTVLFSGTLFPNGASVNVAFEALPTSSITAFATTNNSSGLNTEVVLTITPYGTLGGGRIDGEPFTYPITIVADGNGVTSGLAYNADGSVDVGASDSCMGFTAVPLTGDPCNPFQD